MNAIREGRTQFDKLKKLERDQVIGAMVAYINDMGESDSLPEGYGPKAETVIMGLIDDLYEGGLEGYLDDYVNGHWRYR